MFLDLIYDPEADFRIFRWIPGTGFEITGILQVKNCIFYLIENKKNITKNKFKRAERGCQHIGSQVDSVNVIDERTVQL